MVTAKDLQYRSRTRPQPFDFVPRRGKLIDTIPWLSELERGVSVNYGPRRPANFPDLARMRIDTVELDATRLEGGEKAKKAFIHAAWQNRYVTNDMNLVHGNTTTLAYDLLGKILIHGVRDLPDGWKYWKGCLMAKPDAVTISQEWPTFTIDDMFHHGLSAEQAKENRWWRVAFREDTQTHYAYVDALQEAAKIIGTQLPQDMMEIGAVGMLYRGKVSYDLHIKKYSSRRFILFPWELCSLDTRSHANGRVRLDGSLAKVIGIRTHEGYRK